MNGTRKIAAARWVWAVAPLLLLLAMLSGVALGLRLSKTAEREGNILGLSADGGSVTGLSGDADGSVPGVTGSVTTEERTAGFWAGDEDGPWSTYTRVNIFSDSYINNEGVRTVKSADGDRVVAPGTSGTYDFSLKNLGDTPLRYNLQVETVFRVRDDYLPLRVRMRSGGKWLLGSASEWVTPWELVQYDEDGVLEGFNYNDYTLEWEWPFEADDPDMIPAIDALDTDMGNNYSADDLTFDLYIKASAESIVGPEGDAEPGTGDGAEPVLWAAALGLSVFGLCGAVILRRKQIRANEARQEKS